MMNKYQEALNYLIENIEMLNRHSDGSFCQPYSSKNTLQELVDKATLKKPLIAFADGVTADGSIVQKTALVCPSCKSLLVERQKYCPSCGQALDLMVEMKNVEKETKEIVNSNKSIKLTRVDYEVLKFLQKQGVRYICRDKNDCLNLCENIPERDLHVWITRGEYEYCTDWFKELFKFVKWEDKGPYKVQDILNNCEVFENVD